MLWSEPLATPNTFAGGVVQSKIISNQELAEELRKIVIREFEKRKLHSSFIESIWGADLVDINLISIFNKEICFLLCVIVIYS